MAKYKVTAPDGTKLIVTGPEGASEEEVIAKAQELYKPQQKDTVTEQPKEEPDYAEMGAGEVALEASKSLIPSTVNLIGDLWNAVTSPVETVTTLSQVIGGGMRKGLKNLGIDVGDRPDSEEKFEAVVNEMSKKYGTVEGFKEALATDPASILADASALISGGSITAAKTLGTTTRAGQKAASIAEKAALIDPLTATATGAGKLTTAVVGKAAPTTLAFTSGVGRKSIEQAYEAGFEGGEALKEFRDNMKGADPQGILDDAMSNLEKLRQKKNATYLEGMKDLKASNVKVSYNKIDYALSQAKKNAGKLDDKTLRVLRKVDAKISQAKQAGYNSPVQMDELKRALNEIRMDQPAGSARQTLVGEIQNAVKDAIVKAAPEYAKTMNLYAEAAEKMKELKNVLSLGKNPDTALRKLLSVMRDNVQTNYGKRATLAEELGGSSLLNKIAGQELSSLMPRGLTGRLLGGGAVGFGAVSGGLGGLLTPGAIPALAAASPRLIGEAAQLTGQARRKAQKAAQVLPSGVFSQITAAQRIAEMTEEEE